MQIKQGLTFDDVLLEPKYSEIKSRSNVSTEVEMGMKFSHPIIPANMATICEFEMAAAVIKSGGLAILHRFMPVDLQLKMYKNLGKEFGECCVSIGVKESDYQTVDLFYQNGVRFFCIDIAHGDSLLCHNMIDYIKEEYPHAFIIAGNVATADGAIGLWSRGANVVKVGVGPGSLCTTRIETGNGVPMLSCLIDIADIRNRFYKNKYIIADGGIKNSGDCVKALALADMVMCGNIFAGCPETPGKVIEQNGKKYKSYVGSSTHKNTHVEGVKALVPYKENYSVILDRLLQGIKSGMSYQGVDNLQDLKQNPVFVKITNAGLRESHPHDVILT